MSVIRPAHQLKRGQTEISAGGAVNQWGAFAVAKVDYGIMDKLEIGLHYGYLLGCWAQGFKSFVGTQAWRFRLDCRQSGLSCHPRPQCLLGCLSQHFTGLAVE